MDVPVTPDPNEVYRVGLRDEVADVVEVIQPRRLPASVLPPPGPELVLPRVKEARPRRDRGEVLVEKAQEKASVGSPTGALKSRHPDF